MVAGDGAHFRAQFLVAATGVLSVPFFPDVPGREDFGCEQHHTAGPGERVPDEHHGRTADRHRRVGRGGVPRNPGTCSRGGAPADVAAPSTASHPRVLAPRSSGRRIPGCRPSGT